MKRAQNSCSYQVKELNYGGLLLVEHRRCVNEIISYCNEIAYDGLLIPRRGSAKDYNVKKPMRFIHVSGDSHIKNNSHFNNSQIETIYEWISKNRERIEAKYPNEGGISKIIAVITPFSHQKILLKSKLNSFGKMTIGTVHALQGAERKIVLFSSVYGDNFNHSSSLFFDCENKPNMLNVAVSRAKDYFIMFGNKNIYEKRTKTPSSILYKHLNKEDD